MSESQKKTKNKILLAVAVSGAGGIAGILKLRNYLQRVIVKRLAMLQRLVDERTPGDENLSFEEVEFASRDGLKLHGWFIPALNGGAGKATIITAHGHGGSKTADIPYAAFLHRGGYSVFMLDFRGHGLSEGPQGTSMGYRERLDTAGAVDWLLGRGMKKIGMFGISMGAAIAILATAENSHIKALVSDSAYAHLRRPIAAEITNFSPAPLWFARILGWIGYLLLARHHGFSYREGNPADVVGKISPRPIFIIHGENDRLTRIENAYILYKKAGEPRELWIQPGLGHVEGYSFYGVEYEKRVLNFLDKVDWGAAAWKPPERTLDGLIIPQPVTPPVFPTEL